MISNLISRLRGYSPGRFSHNKAQKYELDSACSTIRADFPALYRRWEEVRIANLLWQSADDQWFCGNEPFWRTFVDHVRHRKCLEIGSGPFGYLAPCYWIHDRIIIDPLVDHYRDCQIETLGSTFFTSDIRTFTNPAEEMLQDLAGAVDGFIVCRNALDHCEDPLAIFTIFRVMPQRVAICYFGQIYGILPPWMRGIAT